MLEHVVRRRWAISIVFFHSLAASPMRINKKLFVTLIYDLRSCLVIIDEIPSTFSHLSGDEDASAADVAWRVYWTCTHRHVIRELISSKTSEWVNLFSHWHTTMMDSLKFHACYSIRLSTKQISRIYFNFQLYDSGPRYYRWKLFAGCAHFAHMNPLEH